MNAQKKKICPLFWMFIIAIFFYAIFLFIPQFTPFLNNLSSFNVPELNKLFSFLFLILLIIIMFFLTLKSKEFILCKFHKVEKDVAAAISSAPIILFAIDTKGNIKASLGKGLRALKMKSGGMVGKNVFSDFPLSSAFISEAFEKAVAGQIFSKNIKIRKRTYSTTYSPYSNPEGKIEGVIILGLDITKKILEDEKLLNEKNKAILDSKNKGKLLAEVSHEIRTPLNVVIGMADLAEKTDNYNVLKEYVHHIKSASVILLGLINNLLDLSKIESGALIANEDFFDLSDVVYSVVSFLKIKAAEKDLKLEYTISDSLPPLFFGDSVKLKQILINIISNAVKFTDEGKVELFVNHVGMENLPNNETAVSFEIKDTGYGIPEEKIQDIFKPFIQLDNTKAKNLGGTGLGLAIADRLVNFFGGEIKVRNNEGNGTTFSFTLIFKNKVTSEFDGMQTQLIDKNFVNKLVENAVVPKGEFKLINRQEIKILLAEDDSLNIILMRELFKNAGYIVDIVFNGVNAVEAVRKSSYDIIFLDINMPLMNGFDAASIIRDISKERGVYPTIIALTADSNEPIANFKKSSIDFVIHKPININELLSFIELAGNESQNVNPISQFLEKDNNKDIFDIKDFMFRINSNKELARQLIAYFIEAAPSLIENIERNLDEVNYPRAKISVHALKGEALSLGAKKMGEDAGKLEELLKVNDLENIIDAVNLIKSDFDDFRKVVLNNIIK